MCSDCNLMHLLRIAIEGTQLSGVRFWMFLKRGVGVLICKDFNFPPVI